MFSHTLLSDPTGYFCRQVVLLWLLDAALNAPVRPDRLFSTAGSDFGRFKRLEMGLPLRPDLLFSFAGRTLAASSDLKCASRSDLASLIPPVGRTAPLREASNAAFRTDPTCFSSPLGRISAARGRQNRISSCCKYMIQARSAAKTLKTISPELEF